MMSLPTSIRSIRFSYQFLSLALLLVVASELAGCNGRRSTATVDYSNANSVSIILKEKLEENGIFPAQPEKMRRGSNIKLGDSKGRRFTRKETEEQYIHFRIDPSFKSRFLTNVSINIEFFDSKFGSFDLQYDGRDADVPDRSEKGKVALVVYQHGEYTASDEGVTFHGTLQWRTATFIIMDPRFENRQTGNADFRIRVTAPEIIIRKVALQRE